MGETPMNRRAFLGLIGLPLAQPHTLSRESHIVLLSGEGVLNATDVEWQEGYASIGDNGYMIRVRPGTVYHNQMTAQLGRKVTLALKVFDA